MKPLSKRVCKFLSKNIKRQYTGVIAFHKSMGGPEGGQYSVQSIEDYYYGHNAYDGFFDTEAEAEQLVREKRYKVLRDRRVLRTREKNIKFA